MYPVNWAGNYLYLRCEVGAPTFSAASSINLLALVVRLLTFMMDGSA